jgi:hypothetical protein
MNIQAALIATAAVVAVGAAVVGYLLLCFAWPPLCFLAPAAAIWGVVYSTIA